MYVCRWLTPEDTCDNSCVAALLSVLERVAAVDILLGQLWGGGEEETEDLQLAKLQANL